MAPSLLRLIDVPLKERRPYREPCGMHDSERAKLVGHHTRRLRELGASESVLEEVIAQLSEPTDVSLEEELAEAAAPRRFKKTYTVKARQGALGFRAPAAEGENIQLSQIYRPEAFEGRGLNAKRQKEKTKVELNVFARSYFRGKDLWGDGAS